MLDPCNFGLNWIELIHPQEKKTHFEFEGTELPIIWTCNCSGTQLKASWGRGMSSWERWNNVVIVWHLAAISRLYRKLSLCKFSANWSKLEWSDVKQVYKLDGIGWHISNQTPELAYLWKSHAFLLPSFRGVLLGIPHWKPQQVWMRRSLNEDPYFVEGLPDIHRLQVQDASEKNEKTYWNMRKHLVLPYQSIHIHQLIQLMSGHVTWFNLPYHHQLDD